MKKRIGNDIKMTWTITRELVVEDEVTTVPVDFSDAENIKIYALLPNSKKFESPFRREDNLFYINIPTDNLKLGIYDLILSYQTPDADFESELATHTFSQTDAFEVVRDSVDEDDEGKDLTAIITYSVDGATFIPSISEYGGEYTLSWTNNKALDNPTPIILNNGIPQVVQDATQAATLANEKAGLANTAATRADNSADDADEAARLANEAAITANNASDALLSNVISLEIRDDMHLYMTTPDVYSGFMFKIENGSLIAII